MASDGCSEVEWKGQAFSYLMHRPDTRSHNYGEVNPRNQGMKLHICWFVVDGADTTVTIAWLQTTEVHTPLHAENWPV